MKNIAPILLMLILVASSCKDKTVETRTYTANVPVYMSFEEFRSAVEFTDPVQMKNPGKIYYKSGFLFINEIFEGIHIIDNTNPSNPIQVSFIKIPGNVDIAIKGHYLYADSYIDLLTFDISDFDNIELVNRMEDMFINALPEYDMNYPLATIDQSKGVVVDWEVKKITEEVEGNAPYVHTLGWGYMVEDANTLYSNGGGVGKGNYFMTNTTGIAGSMARFMIFQDVLYIINGNDIKMFDISDLKNPVEGSEVTTSRVIETLFVYEDKLFVGSTSGMLIYGLTNPASPTYISELDHFTSCDPVVVEDDVAYVTLRSGNRCGNFGDQLDVVDVKDIYNPKLIKSYPMSGPYGLGIDGGLLFICDGDAGLKVYNATDPYKIDENQLAVFPSIHAFDIIPLGTIAMVIGENGLYQYDYNDPTNLSLLSYIAIE
jgi:hypothetical protein